MPGFSTRLSIAAGLALCASQVMAQGNPVARSPAGASASAPVAMQEGFFRPTPDGDPSLTKPRPPAPAASRLAQGAAGAQPMPAAATVMAVPVQPLPARAADSNPASAATAVDPGRWAEEQMDRAEREAQRDRLRAMNTPPPVAPGAFDGTTSDRNR
jgi:hypothetical protein